MKSGYKYIFIYYFLTNSFSDRNFPTISNMYMFFELMLNLPPPASCHVLNTSLVSCTSSEVQDWNRYDCGGPTQMGFSFYCTTEGYGCILQQQLVLDWCPPFNNGQGCKRGEKALTGGEIYGSSVIVSWPDFSILTSPKKHRQ